MKKIFVLLLTLMLAASMLTFAHADEIKVAFITQSLENASQAYAWTQFQKYAPEYGFTVQVFQEDYDPQKGVAAIGTCIADGYKAICINPTDPSAIIPALMDAQAAGVIVGMYSSELPADFKEYRDFMCGTDDYMAGQVAAQTLMTAFPDGCNVVEIGGQSGHDAQIKRHDGFVDTIEGTNINLLDSQDCAAWASDDAQAIAEDFIVKYGDEIDAIYCHWDIGATGIIQALKTAGIQGVYVIGVDGCKVGYDQVREGTQALSIGQSFSQMTQDAFGCITKILNGEEAPDVVWTALDVVTAETIDNFPYPEW
ncbi:MAG: sugar ABC transporter substrate-binding protein [Clostridiales bacterium]|nr:sugar ABC transporter substrate-binding protein [Clostridiales bacterium]OPZ67432.1 MAG: D-ribose-binding periplasmic protein precursor [Firmicutes bacterium ADurb.Bin467]